MAEEPLQAQSIGRVKTMSLLDSLRKGFSFFLMSMGVSAPVKKTKPAPKPAQKPDSGH
jgi:hypothetical protein